MEYNNKLICCSQGRGGLSSSVHLILSVTPKLSPQPPTFRHRTPHPHPFPSLSLFCLISLLMSSMVILLTYHLIYGPPLSYQLQQTSVSSAGCVLSLTVVETCLSLVETWLSLVESSGSGVGLWALDEENPGSNPMLQC